MSEHLQLLSDATRVRTLKLLEDEELSVGEVASVLQLPQSTISRHIKTLLNAGWVSKRTEGTTSVLSRVAGRSGSPEETLWTLVRESPEHRVTFDEDRARMVSILEQRRVDSSAFFGRVAERWSQVRRELFGDQFTLTALLSLLPENLRVADLGCGPGEVAALVAPHVRHVYAVDNNARMLTTCAARLAGVANAEVVNADLAALPLADDCVDAAMLMLVLHTLETPQVILREAGRIVRPGGTVVVLDMQRHSRDGYRRKMGHIHLGFSEEHLADLAKGSSLMLRSYRRLPAVEAAQGPALFIANLESKS